MKFKLISFLLLITCLPISTVNANNVDTYKELNNSSYSDIGSISYEINTQALLDQLNSITNTAELENFMITNSVALTIYLIMYNSLTESKKLIVLSYLVGRTYTSLGTFRTDFNTTVEREARRVSGGGGSGGGGGGELISEGWNCEGFDVSDMVLSRNEENVHLMYFNVNSQLLVETETIIYMCIYDSSGKVNKTIMQNVTVVPNVPKGTIFNYTVDIPDGEYSIKVFIWDQSMNPLASFKLNI